MATPQDIQPDLMTGEGQLKLGEYWQIILKRWWVVVSLAVVATIIGTIHFSLLPNVYTAVVRLLVEKTQNAPRISQDIVSVSPEAGEQGDSYYNTQIAILTGRKIAQLTRSELNLTSNYQIQGIHPPKTQLISLLVTHTDPQLAAKVANKIAEVYIRESKEEGLFLAQQILQWLPEDAELLQDEKTIKQLPGLDKKEFADSLSKVTNDPVLQKFKKDKLEIKDKLAELSQKYKPKHPVIRDLNDRLAYVDKEIKERTKKILNNIRASLEGEMRLTNVRVLDAAVPPGEPSGPNRLKGIQTFALIGLIFGLAVAFLLEYMNQKVYEEKDLKSLANLPFLGYVPRIKEIEKNKKVTKGVPIPPPNYSIIEHWKKNSALSDAIANIRTHILFSMPYEKSKIIMLTSCLPDEGKTTVGTLLALSLSAMGKKVLLIDSDMRRPFLHTHLGLTNDKGLTDFLVGSVEINDIIRSVPGTDLKVITGGNETPNPSELLASDRLTNLLSTLCQEFDRVVIDVAPVLYIPDGLILANHVHCGVLVCGSGMADKKIVKIVKEKFDIIGHGFVGVIINRADYKREGGKYKYFKSYHKRYAKQNLAGDIPPVAKTQKKAAL
jgi:capsular exopolysaccharide synthesis family protein